MTADQDRSREKTPAALVAALLLLPLSGMPSPVSAQQGNLFTPPSGCTAFLTVQSRSCIVSHHWTCEADPAGHSWRIAIGEDGPFYLSYTDSEFRWLRNYDLRNGGQSTLVEPEEDPASLTDLFETGTDSMVYSIVEEGPNGTEQRDYVGFDALTGERVVVDGHTLLITSFSYEYETGFGPRRVNGNQFVSEDWRLFFGGTETVTTPDGGTFEGNYSPMEFAEPGENGFLTMTPLYDCGNTMSGLFDFNYVQGG